MQGGISGLCHRDNQYSQYTLNPKLWKTKFPMSGKFTNVSAMQASPFSVNSCQCVCPGIFGAVLLVLGFSTSAQKCLVQMVFYT